jgi:hypothetical protein
LIQTCGFVFFWVMATIMFLFPPSDTSSMHIISIYWPFTGVELLTLPLENLFPIALIFSTFVLTSFFGGFAEILTQRVLLDVIPNKIRNSMYSLAPTIATLFAIPQIALFGWLLTIIGFPLTLMSCGIVSAMGVLLIVHGFRHDRPVIEEETWGNGNGNETPKEEEALADLNEEEILAEVEAITSVDE